MERASGDSDFSVTRDEGSDGDDAWQWVGCVACRETLAADGDSLVYADYLCRRSSS